MPKKCDNSACCQPVTGSDDFCSAGCRLTAYQTRLGNDAGGIREVASAATALAGAATTTMNATRAVAGGVASGVATAVNTTTAVVGSVARATSAVAGAAADDPAVAQGQKGFVSKTAASFQ